ncbi:MAG: Ig-like domain-containing protein [Candidatus Eisenbacteria sp.]|nr:Ig-like domain-containing protein [Candidatus Eisenbacteria bacterium]
MRRSHLVLALLCAGFLAWTGSPRAEGFGTPIIDGVLDGVYGTAEASDASGDGNGNAVMDLLELYVCNDNNFWYFYFTINADVGATNWGHYRLYVDTTNDANGGTSDPWLRNVVVTDPHKPEFSVGSWATSPPYGPEDTQWWIWDQGGGSWSSPGSIADAALQAGAVSGIEWKVSKTALGSPSVIWCEVWSTGGGTTDNAQDTSNDPAEDWNAVDWSTQAVLANSTAVTEQSGGDITPPIVVSASGLGQDPVTEIGVLFNEPVEETTAETVGNYAVSGEATVLTATLQDDPTDVILELAGALDVGTCYSVTVTNVEDIAGNPIVDNGDTNVDCFKLFDLQINTHMNLWLRDHSAAPDPDTVAVEGGIAPLTWDPTCDDLLADLDGDSTYTANFTFCLPCSCDNGNIPFTALEYKFTHQCDTWESSGNHYYAFADSAAVDTVYIWWEDNAPSDFTTQDIDVIYFLKMSFVETPPVDGVDTVGINGSVLPLTWNAPPDNELRDDGVLPDSVASDGIWTTRLTFPSGSYEYVDYKFLINSVYECEGEGNRNVFLNDELYSTTEPLIMPMLYFDICHPSGSVDPERPRSALRLALQPNPTGLGTRISFTAPEKSLGEISLIDPSGRLVREIARRTFDAGTHTIAFDGRDARGNLLPTGVYFMRVKLNDHSETRRVTLLR